MNTNKKKSDLKNGKGDPWAGQVKATPVPDVFSNADKLTMEENFGFALPMGSVMTNKRKKMD